MKITHISTGAIINGDVQIGSNTFIGSGAIIKEGVRIGNNCLVSMGSILKKNLKIMKNFKKKKRLLLLPTGINHNGIEQALK